MIKALTHGANVVQAPRRFRESLPILVLLDLQRQHVFGHGRLLIHNAAAVTAACRCLLEVARENGIPVAHVRRLAAAPVFNPESPLTSWLDECRPTAHEMVYEHIAPSCYSVQCFSRFFEHIEDPLIVLAGFSANFTGLATVIDGFSRGHRLRFVPDASGSYDGEHGVQHDVICNLIGQFAELTELQPTLDMLTRRHGRGTG